MKNKILIASIIVAAIILIFIFFELTKKQKTFTIEFKNITFEFRINPKLTKNIKVENQTILEEVCNIVRNFQFNNYTIVFSENDDLASIALVSFEMVYKLTYGLKKLYGINAKFSGLAVKDFEFKKDLNTFYLILKSFKISNQTIIKAKLPNIIEINAANKDDLEIAGVKVILCILGIKIWWIAFFTFYLYYKKS